MLKHKKITPGQFLVLGFAGVITFGALLLMLPISANKGVHVSAIDAFFTATSCVCVTGLATISPGDSFNIFGRGVMAVLIQIGGLGVASVGVAIILLAGKKITFKERLLVKEGLNLTSMQGVVKIVKSVLMVTICFEIVGAILSFIVFVEDYPPISAFGFSVFHSISSFNNAGFDVLGGFGNLIPYRDNVLMNLTTCGLIIFGGLGFYVIKEIIRKRSFKKLSLHSKVVITMTAILLIGGTLIIKMAEKDNISWLGAFFFSTSARTAGFSTYNVGALTNAGLFILILLMFIGASPGSTGGGIKTTTAFTLIKSAFSMATNKHCMSYKRKIPNDIIVKAFVITFLAAMVVCVNTLLLCLIETNYTFLQLLFEETSAFGTVGLSTGITTDLHGASKVILIITMFIGRLGPLTMASIWAFKPLANAHYSEEGYTIG